MILSVEEHLFICCNVCFSLNSPPCFFHFPLSKNTFGVAVVPFCSASTCWCQRTAHLSGIWSVVAFRSSWPSALEWAGRSRLRKAPCGWRWPSPTGQTRVGRLYYRGWTLHYKVHRKRRFKSIIMSKCTCSKDLSPPSLPRRNMSSKMAALTSCPDRKKKEVPQPNDVTGSFSEHRAHQH